MPGDLKGAIVLMAQPILSSVTTKAAVVLGTHLLPATEGAVSVQPQMSSFCSILQPGKRVSSRCL